MKSVHSHSFSQVPRAEIQRSKFDRSHGYKTTFDAGRLIPFFLDEALPGDTFSLSTTGFVRMATPIFPVMDNLIMDTHFFAVPKRLLWENWEKFMGAIEDPQQEQPGEIEYLIPQNDLGETVISVADIGDYLGLPINKTNLSVNALPGRAIRFIWNEWFRDQNLQDPIPWDKGDVETNRVYESRTPVRGKRMDYFTSCLPWPQKGPDVTIGISGSANVLPDPGGGVPVFDQTAYPGTPGQIGLTAGEGDRLVMDNAINPGAFAPIRWEDPQLVADLSGGVALTINQLRESFQIQKMYERDARGGTRYVESIWAHFGVVSPDFRMQRPEYLGGGSAPVNINPVYSTADGGADNRGLAELSAVPTVSFSGHGFTKSFTEHSYIIGFCSVRADQTYQQGVNRLFSRKERFDFYFPALAHLGEQEVLNKEIFFTGDPEIDEAVFGYNERFAEYRYKPSMITGRFRSDSSQSLDAWHLSEDFLTTPTLSEQFIRHEPPMDRVLAVNTDDSTHFIADFWFSLQCARPMPLFGVPGNMDRF